MTHTPDLSKLSVAEKDTLILALFEQLTTAHQRIAEQDKIIAAQAERIAALARISHKLQAKSNWCRNVIVLPANLPAADRVAA